MAFDECEYEVWAYDLRVLTEIKQQPTIAMAIHSIALTLRLEHALDIMNVRVVKILFYEAWEEWLQSVLECISEVTVEVCINDGIKRRVEVTDPEENGNEDVGAGTELRPTERCYHIPKEERQPAQKKNSCSWHVAVPRKKSKKRKAI